MIADLFRIELEAMGPSSSSLAVSRLATRRLTAPVLSTRSWRTRSCVLVLR